MPTPMMHVAIAKKVNEKLNLEDDLLYIGCLLTNWTNVEYHVSHFKDEEGIEGLTNPDTYVNKYEKLLDNPIVLGYLIHLLTDRFWNKYMVNNVYLYNNDMEVVGVKTKKKKELTLNPESIHTLKAKTYNKYDNYLVSKKMVSNINEKVLDLPAVEEIKITILELDKKIDEYNQLLKEHKKRIKLPSLNKYSLLNQKEFENNLERCASYVYSYLRRNDIIEP
ncbi:MAG: hypothetical protein IJN90_01375 [Bacilli bacterium]|nr:hypothetical protein [Bacilli bacterium]